MLSRAMTRRMRTGFSDAGNDRLGGQLEPGREVDLWLVAERLARGRDVSPRVADVAGARRLEPLLHRLPEEHPDRLGHLVDGRGCAGGDVEDPRVRAPHFRRADGRVD